MEKKSWIEENAWLLWGPWTLVSVGTLILYLKGLVELWAIGAVMAVVGLCVPPLSSIYGGYRFLVDFGMFV